MTMVDGARIFVTYYYSTVLVVYVRVRLVLRGSEYLSGTLELRFKWIFLQVSFEPKI